MSIHSNIPTDEELAAFASGRLPEDQCARIESYLESNPEAEGRWCDIAVDDSLLTKIRNNVNPQIAPAAIADNILAVGSSLGRYVVRGVLGRGGMGAVYRAHDPIIDREVALKILPTSDEPASDRALLEARAQGRVNHANVVTVYDADHCEHGVFIAMELMSKSLDDVLRESGAQPVDDAASCLFAAIEGLQAAHNEGLIHRDIKPANLLLSKDGVIKVSDFGLAQQLDSQTVTGHSPLAGTPHFMSPEQCRSEKVDVRSDVYALGATLYALLTGDKPYSDSESTLQVLFAHCESAPPNPSSLRQDLPDSCTKIVQRAMAKRPQDRFADVAQFASALRSLSGENPTVAFNKADSSQVWRQLAVVPTGPSLIVLPFENLSGDPAQDYFSDGITHELITQLGRFRELRLVAGGTAFQYKNQQISLGTLREELDVQYAVEGTVRKAGDRVRVSAMLTETEASNVLWTDRFDNDLSVHDIFAVQDEIARQVTSALAQPHGTLQTAERTRRSGLRGLDSYDAVLRFYEYFRAEDVDLYFPVREQLEQVVEKHPTYSQASAALALVYVDGYRILHLDTGLEDLSRAFDLAKCALGLDPHSEMAHQALISALFHRRDTGAFAESAERALTSHPNHADLLADIGVFFACLGNYSRGAALAEKAIALSPRPPGWYYAAGCLKSLHNQDYEDALARTQKFEMSYFWSPVFRAVASIQLGKVDEARSQISRAVSMQPDLAETFRSALAIWNLTEDMARIFIDGVRKAGLDVT